MSITASGSTHAHRPASVWATVGVLMFLGVSAVAGGAAMVTGYTAPDEWLDGIPLIGNWLVPGLVLVLGFGAGSLAVAWGMAQRPRWRWTRTVELLTGHHWAWAATLLIGLGHVVWIGLELAYLPEFSVLQAVYGAVGVALILLPLTPGVRRDLAGREPS